MYVTTNSNMGWYLFSEDKSEVERDDEEQVICHKHHPSPRCRRCRRHGAVAAFSLPPPLLPSLCRRRCLLDAAATATSLPLPLPSHRRRLPCRLCHGAAAAAPPSADLKRPPWRRRCLLFAAATAFLLPPSPLPHSPWCRCRRPPLPPPLLTSQPPPAA